MRFALFTEFFLLITVASYAQHVTELTIPSNAEILNQASIKGKGVYLLIGNPGSVQTKDLSIAFVDEKGELKWSHALLEKMKKEKNSNILLIASESSPSVYVVAYHIHSKKMTDFLIYEIKESGEVNHFTFEADLPYWRGIQFVCASSHGLHLFVRPSVKKEEVDNYSHHSEGVYSAQYFIPHGSTKHEFRNMDARFNPFTVLSCQSGDTLFLYYSARGNVELFKYLVTSDKMLAEKKQSAVQERALGIYYVRPQNGFYHSREDHFYSYTTEFDDKFYITYYPYGMAYWTLQHNPLNGHTYAFSTIHVGGHKVKGRKVKKKTDYLDQVQVYEFDADFNPIDTTVFWYPEGMEKVAGKINMIRPNENGYFSNVYYQVNREGNTIDAVMFRDINSGYGWVTAEMNTGEVVQFKNGKKLSPPRDPLRNDHFENYLGCLLVDTGNLNLPPEAKIFALQNKLPMYSSSQFTLVLEGYTNQVAILLEFKSGKHIRIIRFAPEVTSGTQQFTITREPAYLVEEF